MSILPGDIVFSREGRPMLVTSKDVRNGDVTVQEDVKKIQEAAKTGIKNGMKEEIRAAYNSVLTEVSDPNKRLEIDALMKKIEDLKKENADPRLLKYLDGELKHRIIREKYHPEKYNIDPTTLTTY